jgi:hypothetical protein
MKSGNSKVPFFNGYFPALEQMSQEQVESYNIWLEEMQKGNYLEIEGNLGYVFVYLYSIVEIDKEYDFNEIIFQLTQIQKAYGEYPKINEYCNSWIADCYIALGQYLNALEYKKRSGDNYFSFLNLTGNTYTLEEAIQESFTQLLSKLTDFGKLHLDETKNEMALMYEEIESKKSMNIIKKCTRRFLNEDYFLFTGSHAHIGIKLTRHEFNTEKFRSYIPDCYRLAENRLRRKHGLPQIGEGWVSETQLYYEIKATFPKYKVVPHAKLPFLGRQHLDVFIEDLNIALEYQGEQHTTPIGYFGGDQGHKQILERDAHKKELCEQNGISLIYVFPKYSYENILTEIISICSRREISAEIKSINETERYKIQNRIDKAVLKSQASLPSATQDIKITNRENEFQIWLNHYSDRGYNKKQVLGREKYYLENLSTSQHPIDRHYWLNSLFILYFIHREIPRFIDKCIQRGIEDVDLYNACLKQYKAKDFDSLTSELGRSLRDPHVIYTEEYLVNSFAEVAKKLSVIYEKFKKYDSAIEICERAIKLGIENTTTKGGLEKRLAILRKKL